VSGVATCRNHPVEEIVTYLTFTEFEAPAFAGRNGARMYAPGTLPRERRPKSRHHGGAHYIRTAALAPELLGVVIRDEELSKREGECAGRKFQKTRST